MTATCTCSSTVDNAILEKPLRMSIRQQPDSTCLQSSHLIEQQGSPHLLRRGGPHDVGKAAADRQQRERPGGQEALPRGVIGRRVRRHCGHHAALPVAPADCSQAR